MKFISVLLLALMIMGLISGCQKTTQEVLVGNMKVSIPADWQSTREYKPIIEEIIDITGLENEEQVSLDVYQIPESEDISLIIMVLEMTESLSEDDEIWRGWEYEFEAIDMTKEDFASFFTYFIIYDLAVESNTPQNFQHTIHGCEAVETIFTFTEEDEQWMDRTLFVFAENDLGMLVFMVKESICEEYEDTWNEIMDAVRF